MKIIDSKSKRLLDIDIIQYSRFLKNNGWNADSVVNNCIEVFHNSEYSNSEIVLPFTRKVKSYNSLIVNAFNTIADIYKSDFTKTLNAITNLSEDLIKIRIVHDDVKYGSIQLENGIKLIQGAKELMASTALSTKQKRKLFIGKMPDEINQYLDHLRLGQTEVGSYIINIYSEIRPTSDYGLFEAISFDRKVSLQTVSSIQKISEIVKEYEKKQEIQIFDEAVQDGISANFCKSIIELSGNKQNHNIQLQVGINNNIHIADTFYNSYISSSAIPILQKGYDYLINKDYIEDTELSGFVFKLSRDEDEEAGVVYLSTSINEKMRKVKVYLSEEQYEIAINAHRDQKSVVIRGDLRLETRRAELINVKSILNIEYELPRT